MPSVQVASVSAEGPGSGRSSLPPSYDHTTLGDLPPPLEDAPSSLSDPYTLLSTHHLHRLSYNNFRLNSSQPPSPSTDERYPKPDPFVQALNHCQSLQQLCTQGKESDRKRVLHLGELVGALTQLLRKARILDALSAREEQEQLEAMIANVVKIDSFTDSASATAQRRSVWKWAHSLILDIEKRLVEEHVTSSLRIARQAIEETRELRRQRSIQNITQ